MALVNCTVFIVLACVFRISVGEGTTSFRILAPEIVCPKYESSVIETPDQTVITLQTEEDDLMFSWTVRWARLGAPSQRFILLLWRSARALEAGLNAPQPEPLVFVINNTQLLGGVDYHFNVTSYSDSCHGTTRSFHIDNIKGDQKLFVDGRSDKLSVFLVGGSKIYTDVEYLLAAEVTSCSSVHDYYFAWHVAEPGNIINVDDISGSRLEIPRFTLRAGEMYYVTCLVYRNNSLVTQTELPFQVLFRGLKVHLNVDHLLVTVNNEFTLEAIVENIDYYDETPVFEWSCSYNGEPCEGFQGSDGENLEMAGLPHIGLYEINLLVTVQDQHASTKANVTAVEPILPVIQITPLSRLLNEGSNISLVANASNVAPTCTLTWYFATHEYLASLHEGERNCDDCEHGEALSDSLTIFSLEENFLTEIADFTNETEWRQVTAEMEAKEGRARFVAHCGCSLTFSCKTQGMVYADVSFHLNPGPTVADIKISPEVGTAMETVFRVSKLAASDPDKPLLFSLLCSLGDGDTIVLGSNLDHLAVDTFLPYVGDTGTDIWAVVCDSFGACSSSTVMSIHLVPGEARSLAVLVEEMKGFVLRCEAQRLDYIVRSTVFTYMKTKQNDALSTFTKYLLKTLPTEDHCLRKHQDYLATLHWLASHGIDILHFNDPHNAVPPRRSIQPGDGVI